MDIITQSPNEANIVFNYRKQFIELNKDKFEKNDLIKYSKILANIKFKKCKYDKRLMDILKNFL